MNEFDLVFRIIIFVVIAVLSIFILSLLISILLHEREKKKHANNDCGWKQYDIKGSIHRFTYCHGDQNGILYKIINDKEYIVIEPHISIETADAIMKKYETTGRYYPIDSQNNKQLTSHS